jgi:hypothetical protein
MPRHRSPGRLLAPGAPPSAQPARSRHVPAAITGVTAALFSGCGLIPATNGSAPSTPPVSQPALRIPAPSPAIRGVCVDPTSSSALSFSQTVLAGLEHDVASWPAFSPAGEKAAIRATRGLDLTVRLVSTHASATDQRVVDVLVPAVNGLAAPPAQQDPALAADQTAWNAAAADWNRDHAVATKAAEAGERQLHALALDRTTNSGIFACVAALGGDVPASGTGGPRLAVASDLMNNTPFPNADLHRIPVLIVQSLPSGSELQGPALERNARSVLAGLNAGPVTVVRGDDTTAAQALTQWLEAR